MTDVPLYRLTPYLRKRLVHKLSDCCPIDALAVLTDFEILQQAGWCFGVKGGVNHVPEHAGAEEEGAHG